MPTTQPNEIGFARQSITVADNPDGQDPGAYDGVSFRASVAFKGIRGVRCSYDEEQNAV